MALKVNVKKASSLPNVEKFGKSDPFAVLLFRGKKEKTDYIDDNLDPEWNESLEFVLDKAIEASESLQVEVYDHEKIGSPRILGKTDVPLKKLTSEKTVTSSYSLVAKDGSSTKASIELELNYTPPEGSQGGGASTGGSPSIGDQAPGTPGGLGDSSGSDAARKKSTRDLLPNRPIDFQVRFHVLEARRLIGSNLKPVVKVAIGEKNNQTKPQQGTGNPYWNETFECNFLEKPKDMFEKIIDVRIYNSKGLFKDAFLGSFKFDVGLVYDEPQHSIIHKWLLMTDPLDPSSEAKGYLKISVVVLGPGDEPMLSPAHVDDENVDIESNLLRPSGVRLQASTVSVKIYQAEDLPQMDSDLFQRIGAMFKSGVKKDLVDPYCTVSFAGHSERTHTLMSTMNPVWNKEINLGVRMPSMCSKLRISVKDYDKLSKDDYIGTAVINMSEISAPGKNGFLPTFGPSFINVYGSPREVTGLVNKYEYLDKGKAEGAAYRGRLLVELSVDLGTVPTTPVEDITEGERDRITPYLRRLDYKLYATFFHATMVSPSNKQVEFEVSIGNYGNKLDRFVLASSSTTQPMLPVSDGVHYHYLPWFEDKPCVLVESQWEDNEYRISTMNIVQHICKELDKDLQECRYILAKRKNDKAKILTSLAQAAENVAEHLSHELPKLPSQGLTQLDINLHKVREEERRSLLSMLHNLPSETRHSPVEFLDELETVLARMQNMAKDPQVSVPDVVVWMLSDNVRVAYARIPASQLLFSEDGMACGEMCGKIHTVMLHPPAPELEGSSKRPAGCAQVRLLLWLGMDKHASRWAGNISEGSVAVFAETYENQAWFLGKWGTTGLLRPNFSDIKGKRKLPHDLFEAPDGWEFEGEWFVNPEKNVANQVALGGQTVQEEVYEYQFRKPFTSFDKAESLWRNSDNDELGEGVTKDSFALAGAWRWTCEWSFDVNRAVDGLGWEYAGDGADGPWTPVERVNHVCRRKRWVRARKLISTPQPQKESPVPTEVWEYAKLPHLVYKPADHPLNMARRRRWHRKLVQVRGGKMPVFYFPSKDKKRKKKTSAKEKPKEDASSSDEETTQAPRMYLMFSVKYHNTYQLRVHLYQARGMYASDDSGLSDPYCFVSFGRHCLRSEIIPETVSPLWDQTLIFNDVTLYGKPTAIQQFPPFVMLEFYDKDLLGKDEYLGQCSGQPLFNLDPSQRLEPVLHWLHITRYNKLCGEVLVAFELHLLDADMDLPPLPPKNEQGIYKIPTGISPILQKTRIEVLCWGVRDMKKLQLLPVNNPIVEIECAGTIVHTDPMPSARENPNFADPVVSMDVNIPKEPIYAPSLNIRVLDKRAFGRKPMVGVFSIKSLEDYHVDPVKEAIAMAAAATAVSTASARTSIFIPMSSKDLRGSVDIRELEDDVFSVRGKAVQLMTGEDPDIAKSSDFDWWSKFYSSIEDDPRHQPEYLEAGYDKLLVYDNPLERFFSNFEDLVTTFSLYHGKGDANSDETPQDSVGKLKGAIKICPFHEDGEEPPHIFRNVPSSSKEECLVRVYIIRGIGLQAQDIGGKSDPYIKIQIGKTTIKDKDNYIPNCLDPLFGKMFEVTATIPLQHILKVTVMDYDLLSADDVIGETCIDLENRYLSSHRALCGVSETFSNQGLNRWRDIQMPTDILSDLCLQNSLGTPVWTGSQEVSIGRRRFHLKDFEPNGAPNGGVGAENERLALYIVRQHGIVPEHVETRPLYSDTQPGIEQGRLQMWVDIFPKSLGEPPPAVDISPRKPKKYTLRVVIWNTADVLLDEVSLVTGEAMSDIYVKGWMQGEDQTQKTDVHYRSMDGTGNFNWRLVFPLEYIPQEKVMVLRKKEHFFSLEKTEFLLPPKLTLQVWDNDLFNPDDFIGTVDLRLDQLPVPAKNASKCSLDLLPDGNSKATTADLFKMKRMSGWWPMYSDALGKENRELTGKVEMDLEIVTEEEELEKPAAVGREEPNSNPNLPEPNRPSTSFLWFTSPWKTFQHIVWKYYKWHIILTIVAVLAALILAIFIYTLPGMLGQWLMGSILPKPSI